MENRVINIIPFFGGKSQMLKKIYEIAGKIKHSIFVDAFGGSGKVVLNYPYKDKRRIYNDKDFLLYNLLRVIKEKPQAFLEGLKKALVEMDTYFYNPVKLLEIKRIHIDHGRIKDEIELSVWTFLIYMFAYGSSWKGKIMIFRRGNHLQKILSMLHHPKQYIKIWHETLQEIELYNKDYKEIVDMFNSPDTLLFLDPPYLGFENEYRIGKEGIVFEMLDYVKDFKGSIIFTHNTKERRKEERWKIEKMMEILKEDGYQIVEVTRTKNVGGAGACGYSTEIIAWKGHLKKPNIDHFIRPKNI